MTRTDVVRRTAAVALMCLAASAIFFRLFGVVPVVGRIWPVVVVCCVGYAVGTAGGQRVQRGIGALVALLATVLAALALGAMTIADADGDVALSSFLAGLVEGLGRILTSVVPAPVTAETIIAGILIAAYGALVGCLLVTTSQPASSVGPALFVFLAGLMLSQGSTTSALPFAAAFIASVVLALTQMPTSRQRNVIEDGAEFAEVERAPTPGRPWRIAIVLVSVLAVTVVSTLAAPVTGIGSIRSAFDPHRKEDFRPDTNLDGDDVVSLATKWQTLLRQNPFEVFTVAGPDVPTSVNWAINAKFDGVAWSSITAFDLVEGSISVEGPPRLRLTRQGVTGFQTGARLPGPWLPATYRPVGVAGTPSRVDDEGTLVAGDNVGAAKQYSVESRSLALPSRAILRQVRAVNQPEYGTLRELPRDFPEELRLFAVSVMSGASTPFDKVQALADFLSTPPYGEQVDSIDNGLDGATLRDLVVVSKRGTQAQFATAFALMARSQGYPTRLVVGYAVPRSGAVRSTDVIVYPEVQFTRIGWVPFAPGPRDRARGVPVVQVVKNTPKPPQPTPTPTATPQPTPAPIPPPEAGTDGSGAGWVLAGLMVLGLLAWPLLVRWRRNQVRRALRRGDPDAQVIGAWTYVRGARRRLGQPLDPALSAASYVTGTASALSGLASAVETAMYAPESVRPDEVPHVWDLADAVVTESVRGASRGRRLRWRLVPWRGRA